MTATATKSNSLVDLRCSLIENGYHIIPVNGKRPHIKRWSRLKIQASQVEGYSRKYTDHTNTGILTGDLVAVDIDAPDLATAEKLIARFLEIPGAMHAPCRVGKPPKAMFISRAAMPREKAATAEYIINSEKHQVEIMGAGQQIVAFGIHPDTQSPYVWSNGDPLSVPMADLPVIAPEDIDAFLADADAILASVGEPIRKAEQPSVKQSGCDSFWTRVNSAALARPDSWVPTLFNGATREAGTGAWRVTSKELDRPLQEDISIHPDGIRDFGREQPETAINLVVEYGGAATTKDAALWLCERLGVDPATLGWETRTPVTVRFGQPSTLPVAANDDEPDEARAHSRSFPAILRTDSKLESFTHPGGLVEDLIDWIVSSSPTPSRELALGGVLAFLAALIGRRYSTGQRDTRANCYIVALAPSGYGKDHSRSQIKRLGEAADGYLDQYFGPERIMSASGLRSALERWPSLVCFMDEFGGFMRDILDKRAGEHKRAVSVDLRDYFSASNTNFAGAEYAKVRAVKVYNPNLNIYGTATPGQFWSALSNASAEDGLLPRMLLFNVGEDWPDTVDPTRDVRTVPATLIDRLLPLAGIQPRVDARRRIGAILDDNAKEGGKKPLDPTIVQWTGEAEAGLKHLIEEARLAARDASELAAPFISRLAEHATKLALIVAVASKKRDAHGKATRALIDLPKWEWALGLARHCVGEMLASVEQYVSDNDREAVFKLVAGIIEKGGDKGVSPGVVIDRMPKRFSRVMRQEVLDDLTESGRVIVIENTPLGGGRKSRRLRWRG